MVTPVVPVTSTLDPVAEITTRLALVKVTSCVDDSNATLAPRIASSEFAPEALNDMLPADVRLMVGALASIAPVADSRITLFWAVTLTSS
jgi:hypothetical protein